VIDENQERTLTRNIFRPFDFELMIKFEIERKDSRNESDVDWVA
jgi:hypothetical protein